MMQDFALSDVLENDEETPIIFAWRSGQGIGQHRNSERGASKVNLRSGDYFDSCDNSNDFYALHGALLLVAWLMVAPYGLYQARYCAAQCWTVPVLYSTLNLIF